MKNARRQMALAVVCAMALTAFSGQVRAAEDPVEGETAQVAAGAASGMETHALDTIYVYGEGDPILQGGLMSTESIVGFLGHRSVMEVPFSQTNVTEKALETFGGPDKPLDSVLVNSPSIRSTGSILHSDFYFRGSRTNGTNFYVNGVPGVLTQFNTPMHIFSQVDLISGPNVGIFGTGVQYETTSPGGIISAITKKAPDEGVFNYTQTISGRGLFGEYLDWGRRFGEDNEWGIRIMTENLNGTTSVKGTDIDAQSIYANIDHRSENTRDNLFFGYRNLHIQKGIRWFMLNASADWSNGLPAVVDGSNDYGFDGMIKATEGWMLVYNHEQRFNDHWDMFFNFGMQDNELDKNVMANGGSGYTLNPDGSFTVTSRAGATPQKYYYWQVGTTAHYNTGDLKHDITFSYNQAWRNRKSAYDNSALATIGTGNIYTGIIQTDMPDTFYRTRTNNKTRVKSFSAVDYMTYDKWNFVLGIHRHEVRSQAYSYGSDGSPSIDTTNSDATSPTYGIVYRPNEEWSIYGSHSENFDSGYSVNTTYENQGDVLPPTKSKQNEIGVKFQKNGLLYTLAYFDIKEANNISVQVADYQRPFLRQDGEVRRKGVEFAVNGRLSDKWSIWGGLAHLDAKQQKTEGGTLDGKRVTGTSEWTAVLGLQYEPNEDWAIMGRAVYTGETPLFNEQLYAPGYVVYDLGVTHRTEILGVPATLSLMCANVFDKKYWMVSRGDQIYPALPRTYTFSARFNF